MSVEPENRTRRLVSGTGEWLRWYGRSLMVVVACLLGGLLLMVVLGMFGLGPNGVDDGSYAVFFFFVNLFVPFTATAYLVLFGLFARWGRRPRFWAFVLTPVFWSYTPYFALLPWIPPFGAMWVSLLVLATYVELPPSAEAVGRTVGEPRWV